MSLTTMYTGLAICFAIIIFLVFFGNKMDAAFARRKQQKVLRRENAKPVLILNWGTHHQVGKMCVVVWADDFFQFAAEQTKKGSVGMFFATHELPAAVFTETGNMPDGSNATGSLCKLHSILQSYGNKVKVENRCDLFIPQLNDKYADSAWQKKHCGIIEWWKQEAFAGRFYDIARSKAA